MVKHIFVVDDEKNIRDVLQKYIENEGYKITLFFRWTASLPRNAALKPRSAYY